MVAGSILGIVSGSAVCPDVNSSTSRGYRYIPLPLVTPVLYRFVSLAIAVQQGASYDAAERRLPFWEDPMPRAATVLAGRRLTDPQSPRWLATALAILLLLTRR